MTERDEGFALSSKLAKENLRLAADLTAAHARIQLLEGAIERQPCTDDCESNYCVQCGKHHDAHDWNRGGTPRFEPKPCNCWKKAVLAPKETTDGR